MYQQCVHWCGSSEIDISQVALLEFFWENYDKSDYIKYILTDRYSYNSGSHIYPCTGDKDCHLSCHLLIRSVNHSHRLLHTMRGLCLRRNSRFSILPKVLLTAGSGIEPSNPPSADDSFTSSTLCGHVIVEHFSRSGWLAGTSLLLW